MQQDEYIKEFTGVYVFFYKIKQYSSSCTSQVYTYAGEETPLLSLISKESLQKYTFAHLCRPDVNSGSIV